MRKIILSLLALVGTICAIPLGFLVSGMFFQSSPYTLSKTPVFGYISLGIILVGILVLLYILDKIWRRR